MISKTLPILAGLTLSASLLVVPVAAQADGDAVTVDTASTISTSPVAEAAAGSVKVDFSSKYTVKNRPVVLQQFVNNDWTPVGATKMNSSGVATFAVTPVAGASYRVLASAYKTKKTPVASKTATAPWQLDREYFNGSSNYSEWSVRQQSEYTKASSRACTAVWADNSTATANGATLSVKRDTNTTHVTLARNAGCKTKPNKYVFSSGMLSTEGHYTISTGIVAARVKFSSAQHMHAGVWLQSAGVSEIDMESYGKGKGIASIYHLSGKKNPTAVKKYNNKSSSWWNTSHVYSIEFTTSKIIYRIDGKVSGEVKKTFPATNYFLVLSFLTSDWESKHLTSKSKASMSVDWVKTWTK